MAASKPNLFYIWNFFEKTGGYSSRFSSFVDYWTFAANVVRKNDDYIATQLHRNLDPKATFPYVNHAAFDGTTFAAFGQSKPTAEWMEVAKEGRGGTGTTVAYPGGYKEIESTTGKPLGPWLPKGDNIFLVSAFKVADEKDTKLQEAFEKDWKESSGTNFILKNAPKELGISNCGLYKKFTERPGLMYVLRAELTGARVDSEPAKTFLAQLKEFKYPDYFQKVDNELYMADPENIIFPQAGKKDLPEGLAYKPE
ncbi:uncharacterized protein LOC117303873 [Asterias rubens]|uniref:uncharacterized protein LOC117303873 n=1 Tax=Asterias rubens TaxID=7604 RepID=UPI00145550F6|nr:uncharacterized protein LOC117303873 [Asterias rubens]